MTSGDRELLLNPYLQPSMAGFGVITEAAQNEDIQYRPRGEPALVRASLSGDSRQNWWSGPTRRHIASHDSLQGRAHLRLELTISVTKQKIEF